MTRCRSLVLAVLLAMMPSAGASAATTCPGKNGPIAAVVESPPGQPFRSHIATVDGRGRPRTLIPAPGVDASFESPSFSCDGRRIVYAGHNGGTSTFLEVADAHSGETIPRHSGEGWRFPQPPFFIPEGAAPKLPFYLDRGRLAFSSSTGIGLRRGTYVARWTGARRRMLTVAAVAGSIDGKLFLTSDEWGHKLFLLDSRGGRRSLVPALHGPDEHYRSPSFSPNGQEMVYERDGDVFVLGLAGRQPTQVTDDGEASSPIFSPDGQWIAYVRGPDRAREIVEVRVGEPNRLRVRARFQPAFGALGELAWAAR